MKMTQQTGNPVVWEAQLDYYPEWKVRKYMNGMFDGAQIHGSGVTPGFETFNEVVKWIRENT